MIALTIFVGVIYLMGYVAETHAHRGEVESELDLRFAYAADLLQALSDNRRYEGKRMLRELPDLRMNNLYET